MEPTSYKKYEQAQKQVKRIKSFYRHVFVYVLVILAVFIVRFVVFPSIGFQYEAPGFNHWLDLNTYGMAVVWLIALLIQAIFVFKPRRMKEWEHKKINELMEREEKEVQEHWK